MLSIGKLTLGQQQYYLDQVAQGIEDYYVGAREPKVPRGDDDMKTAEAHAAWQAEMERVYGLAELIIAKQRHGSTGKVRLRFEAKITKFSDLAEGAYSSDDFD